MATVLFPSGIIGFTKGASSVLVTGGDGHLSLLSASSLVPRLVCSSGSSCELPAVIGESEKSLCALVRDSTGLKLEVWSAESSKPKREPTRRTSLDEWKSHKAFSLHALSSGQQECAAIILESKGKWLIAWLRIDDSDDRACHSLALNDKVLAASSHQDTVAIASRSTEAGSTDVKLYSFKDGKISVTRSFRFSSDGKASIAQLCHHARAYTAIAWSDGNVSVIKMDGPQIDMRPPTFSSEGQRHEGLQQDGGRKRKAPKATLSPTPSVQISAYDATRLFVSHLSDLGSEDSHRGISHSLLDVRYGCWTCPGSVDLDASILQAAAAASDPSGFQSLVLRSPIDGVSAIVLFGGALIGLRLSEFPNNLLTLMGQLKVTQPSVSRGLVDISSLRVLQSAKASQPPSSLLMAASKDLISNVDSEKDDASLMSELQEFASSLAQPSSSSGAGLINKAKVEKVIQKSIVRAKRSNPPIELLSLLLQLMASSGHWTEMEALLSLSSSTGQPLICIKGDVVSSSLASAVVAKKFVLLTPLCHLMLVSDAEPAPLDLLAVLQELLSPTTASNQASRKAYMISMRDTARAVIARSEELISSEMSREESSQLSASKALRDQIDLARCAAASVDGFSPRETMLHSLLSLIIDPPALQMSLRSLSNNQVDSLMSYLGKWADKYSNELGEGSSLAIKSLQPFGLLVPSFAQVLDWTQVLLDSHLSRLLMAHDLPPAVERLMSAIQAVVSSCQQMMPLLGATEHIRQRAPLPAAHVAAATQYTVELLGL